MKRAYRYLPFLLLCLVPLARAQGPYDFALSFGVAQDPSNGLGIESASSVNPIQPARKTLHLVTFSWALLVMQC
jgi:hypothetical protein